MRDSRPSALLLDVEIPRAQDERSSALGRSIDFRVGDVIRLRKPHPCGSYDWSIVRIGADIGLRCLKCNHGVLLTRRDAERRLTALVSRAQHPDPFAGADTPAGSDPTVDRAE